MPEDLETKIKKAEQEIPAEQKTSGLQTFQHDVAEAMRQGQGNIIKIAVAEEARNQKESQANLASSPENKKYLVMTIVLVGLGILALAGYFVFRAENVPTVTTTQTQQVSSLVRTENHVPLMIGDLSSDSVTAKIAEVVSGSVGSRNTISDIYFVTTEKGPYGSVTSSQFFDAVGSTIPSSLTRALGSKFMFGVYQGTTPVPFLLFKTDSYQSTFAGMLSWERSMFDDLYQILSISIAGDNQTLFAQKFIDGTIKNRDARILRNAQGQPVLEYLFLDDQTLLITASAEPVDELMSRLSASQLTK
jgi:hypothetical protein